MSESNSITNKKTLAGQLDYPPKWLTIGITNRCNNRCEFCSYHAKDAKNQSNVYNIPYELTFNDFKKMVDLAYQGGIPRVHICGTGEPFVNKDVLKMIDYCADVYGQTSIQTNFYAKIFKKYNYLDEIIKRKDRITYITTDILSGIPEQHNQIKNGSQFDDVIHSLAYLSNATDIKFDISWILTKQNYDSIPQLVDCLISNNILNVQIRPCNLFTYDFNEMTSQSNLYTSKDLHISQALMQAKSYGEMKGISITIPEPADKSAGCTVFWEKLQTWPVEGNDPDRYHENLIPHACRAVVKGNLNSLGYIFDYDHIMDFWNNDKMVTIRENLHKGIYPSKECQYCYSCSHTDDFKYHEPSN